MGSVIFQQYNFSVSQILDFSNFRFKISIFRCLVFLTVRFFHFSILRLFDFSVLLLRLSAFSAFRVFDFSFSRVWIFEILDFF